MHSFLWHSETAVAAAAQTLLPQAKVHMSTADLLEDFGHSTGMQSAGGSGMGSAAFAAKLMGGRDGVGLLTA